MKLCFPFLLVAAASALGASDSPTVPAPRPRLTDEMRRSVENSAPTQGAAANGQKPSDGPVRMDPVQVTGSYQAPPRTLEEESPPGLPFTLKDGGTIFKSRGSVFTTELQFKYNPAHNGFDILKISF
jgi:hypothetical protein